MQSQPDKIGRYSITGELGKGSMGVVYEGRDESGSAAPVAIKIFQPEASIAPEESDVLRERFLREGQSLSQINHPNIVRVLETGQENNLDYIVMEKLEGFDLKSIMAMGTVFALADVLDILRQLLVGLEACHERGIIHRDIKPANIVRADNGELKLTDFGIAKVVTDATLAQTGTIVGTPNYMSPEQIRGDDIDERTDIFSLGVVAYELLTSRKPFDGPDVTAIMYNVTNIHPPSPLVYNQQLPGELEELLYKVIAKDVSERFDSAREVAQALEDVETRIRFQGNAGDVLASMPGVADSQQNMAPTRPGAASAAGPLPAFSGTGSQSRQLPSSTAPGKVFCIDCGMENSEDDEFCVRCMRPLITRDRLNQLAARRARQLYRVGRGDYTFLTCLSIVISAAVIFIVFLLIRGLIM